MRVRQKLCAYDYTTIVTHRAQLIARLPSYRYAKRPIVSRLVVRAIGGLAGCYCLKLLKSGFPYHPPRFNGRRTWRELCAECIHTILKVRNKTRIERYFGKGYTHNYGRYDSYHLVFASHRTALPRSLVVGVNQSLARVLMRSGIQQRP